MPMQTKDANDEKAPLVPPRAVAEPKIELTLYTSSADQEFLHSALRSGADAQSTWVVVRWENVGTDRVGADAQSVWDDDGRPPWDNTWTNANAGRVGADAQSAWSDDGRPPAPWGDWTSYKNVWNNASAGRQSEDEKRLECLGAQKLGEIVHIRRDNEQYGFVHDLARNVVFYAPASTLEQLDRLLGMTIAEINDQRPEVIEAFRL